MSPPHQRRARRVGRPDNGEDVRGTILSAALRHLEETGSPDRVTVAAIVAEAGCTPPSLYYYWPNRELLLQEASATGWAQFRASQAAAVVDDPEDLADSVERLRARGRAYLQFALARPALFRVLFLEPPARPPADPSPRPATGSVPGTGRALDDLVSDVVDAMATGRFRPGDPLTTALALWSAIHGVATLWAVTPDLPADLAHSVADLAQDAVLRGLTGSQDAPPSSES